MGNARRPLPLVLAVLLVWAALLAAPAGASGLPDATPPDADHTVTRIELATDGSATWVVRVRTRLRTEEDVAQFERFRESFERNSSDHLDRFRGRIRGVVRNAADATGREMAAVDFAVSTSVQEVPRRWGVVTYRFRWTRFARVDDGDLVAGDAFGSGFYIEERDSLEVVVPRGYRAIEVDPSATGRDGRVVTWDGPESFADGRPRVVAEPASAATAAQASGSPAAGGEPPVDGGGEGDVRFVLGALAFAAVLVVAGAYARRRPRLPADTPDVEGRDGTDDAGSDVVAPAADRDVGGADATAAADPSSTDDGEALLTDEDRVVRLLGERGGRVKQATVSEAFGWSSSKTSRVVGEMAEVGRVEKLRIGRENVLQATDDGDAEVDPTGDDDATGDGDDGRTDDRR